MDGGAEWLVDEAMSEYHGSVEMLEAEWIQVGPRRSPRNVQQQTGVGTTRSRTGVGSGTGVGSPTGVTPPAKRRRHNSSDRSQDTGANRYSPLTQSGLEEDASQEELQEPQVLLNIPPPVRGGRGSKGKGSEGKGGRGDKGGKGSKGNNGGAGEGGRGNKGSKGIKGVRGGRKKRDRGEV